jgi:Protein of unknown function (DUF3277)
MASYSYSFKDITGSIQGVGLYASFGNGSGAAEGGISIESADDKNAMTIGAGGDGVHSLRADDSAMLTFRLLRTSPINAILQQAYNLQALSSLSWGKNTVTVRDVSRGDLITCNGCAFKKVPDLEYSKDATEIEWVFDVIKRTTMLGVGTPEI